ncbi:hypothetical protein [Streptomyces sp. NPDC000618]|uniref:hypothetical protein n=1 Tax=Streptomyces sp. NPDC000618 TaxID=3154265 RepID=UPI00331A3985
MFQSALFYLFGFQLHNHPLIPRGHPSSPWRRQGIFSGGAEDMDSELLGYRKERSFGLEFCLMSPLGYAGNSNSNLQSKEVFDARIYFLEGKLFWLPSPWLNQSEFESVHGERVIPVGIKGSIKCVELTNDIRGTAVPCGFFPFLEGGWRFSTTEID